MLQLGNTKIYSVRITLHISAKNDQQPNYKNKKSGYSLQLLVRLKSPNSGALVKRTPKSFAVFVFFQLVLMMADYF